jgi:folate-binding protein YgfZ
MNSHPTSEQLQQYEALRHKAALAALDSRGEIVLSGADCASFLHNFCTNEVKALAPGQGCEAFFCNLQGKILGHGYIFRCQQSLSIDTVAGGREALASHLDRYLIREDVTISDRTAEAAKLLLCGPKAVELLTALSGSAPSETLLSHRQAKIGDVTLQIRCLPYVLPRSYCLVCDPARLAEIRERLLAAGAVACSPEVLEAARIESGAPLYGTDITDANLPQEVARDEPAISFQKGCYLGQETVARIDALGHVNRQLVGVRLEGDALPPAEATLTSDDQPVGQMTSAAWSPQLKAVLVLAYVKSKHAKPGTVLACEGVRGEVVSLPVC